MPRTKAFDEDTALHSAMQLFWKQGYHATSMQQLLDATGLSRSSLYETFGGKEALFLAAIERYLNEINRVRVQAMLNDPSPRCGIEAFFSGIVEFAVGDAKKLGCMMTNSAIEFGSGKGPIEDRIFGVFKAVEEAFVTTVERGQQLGEIPHRQTPRELARFLMTQVQGVRVMSRVNPERDWLQSAVSVALCVIRKSEKAA
ncbi:MAG: TetR/AcrR family transcriptional regulator [Pseudomonadota bacterium]